MFFLFPIIHTIYQCLCNVDSNFYNYETFNKLHHVLVKGNTSIYVSLHYTDDAFLKELLHVEVFVVTFTHRFNGLYGLR